MFNSTKTLLLALSFATTLSVAAQDKKAAKKEESKSFFKFDVSYLTNSVYLGRKDSAILPYLTPSFGYFDKSGFYITTSASYSSTDNRIDYYSLDAGYDFSINDKLSGSISANKSFYNDNSNNVSSDIGAGLSTGFTYDFDVLTLHAGASLSFASKTDVGINISADHAFYFGEDGNQWSVTPTATLNMNTLHFYEGYTNRANGNKQKKKDPLVASVTSTTTITNKNANNLTLMDYELSIPVGYDTKKWGVYFTPTVAIPQNPIYTKTTSVIKLKNGNIITPPAYDSTPDSEKNLSSTFYAEVGVYFKF